MQIFTQSCCIFYSNLVKYLLKSCILFTQNLFFTPLSKTRGNQPQPATCRSAGILIPHGRLDVSITKQPD